MTHVGYANFIEAFEHLSPYEVDHFCRIFFSHYSMHVTVLERRSMQAGDLREILITVMQKAQLEMAELKLEEAQLELALIRSRIMVKENDTKKS